MRTRARGTVICVNFALRYRGVRTETTVCVLREKHSMYRILQDPKLLPWVYEIYLIWNPV